MRRISDDGFAAAACDERDCRLDLRTHAAAVELSRREMLPGFRERHLVHPALRGFPVVDRDALDAGGDYKALRMQRAGEQAGGVVLVDDRLDAAVLATLVLDHRNSAAAAGHDDVTRIDQMRDDLEVED